MERIALAREYRVAEWLRDAYLELTQKTPLDLEGLRPEEPYSSYSNPQDRNWETDAKKWEAVSRDWEMLARISQLQTKMGIFIASSGYYYYCQTCNPPGLVYPNTKKTLCKCRVSAMVDETFQGELESLKENPEYVEPPLPCKLSILVSFFFVC